MNLIDFIRLINYHIKLLVIVPIVVMSLILIFLNEEEKNYNTNATIYTGFASGFSLTGGERVDFFVTKTKFDNLFQSIKSRTTREDISLRILAFYLSQDPIISKDMSPEVQEEFHAFFENDWATDLIIKNDEERTHQLLKSYYYSSFDNEIYYVLNSDYSPFRYFFGLEKLMELVATQEGTSDRVLINYECTDAGIAYNTVKIALKVILDNAKSIKYAESDNVVQYFLRESEKAAIRLAKAEEELSILMTNNNIINYYEQTKWIASRNEDFEVAYQKEKLELVAAQAEEEEAQIQMELTHQMNLKSSEIVLIRKEIRKINAQLAEQEINALVAFEQVQLDSMQLDSIAKQKNILRNQLLSLKDQLNIQIDELFALKNGIAGIKIEEVASAWLEAVLQVEKYMARIELYKVFKTEFEATYSSFAKLGSKIKQMERRIGVLEKDYLDLLASLNDARLMKQNIETSNIRIIDNPFYPVNAQKSKKLLIIIIGGIVSVILILAILILMEYLDNSIKTPERARELTNLHLVGGFPIFMEKELEVYDPLYSKLSHQITTHLNYIFHKKIKGKIPFVIGFTSTRAAEGKTQIAHVLLKELRDKGEKVLFLSPESSLRHHFTPENNSDNIMYSVNDHIGDYSLKDIAGDSILEDSQYKYIFVEVPEIIGSDLPIKILEECDHTFLILKSSRVWNDADNMAIKSLSKALISVPVCILNGTHVDNLESIIGEIPKARKKVRKWVKAIASLNLNINQKKF